MKSYIINNGQPIVSTDLILSNQKAIEQRNISNA